MREGFAVKRDDYIKQLLDESSYYDIKPHKLLDIYYRKTLKPMDLTPPYADQSILIYGLRCPVTYMLCFVGVSYEPLKDYRKDEQTFGYSAPVLAAWLAFLQERYRKPIPVVLHWVWNGEAAKTFFNSEVVSAKHMENPYLLNQFISNEGFYVQTSCSVDEKEKITIS